MDIINTQTATIVGLIASIITILSIFSPLKKIFTKIRSKNEIKIDSGNIENLFFLSYLFLRTDQIKQTGLWGRTITKYISLNFPDNKDVNRKLGHYKANGSITHTSHALKALYEVWQHVGHYPDLHFITIEEYLR